MKKNFTKIFLFIAFVFVGFVNVSAQADIPTDFVFQKLPAGSIDINVGNFSSKETVMWWTETSFSGEDWFVKLLVFVQDILLKIVLPVVAVGVGIYIAYELLTAEWDSARMSRAWKAIVYGAIAIISILLSSLIVNIISNISL